MSDCEHESDSRHHHEQCGRRSERTRRCVALELGRAEFMGARPETNERHEPLDGERVRPEVVHDCRRHELETEEAIAMIGEPRCPLAAECRQNLAVTRKVEEGTELREVQRDVDRDASDCEGDGQHRGSRRPSPQVSADE